MQIVEIVVVVFVLVTVLSGLPFFWRRKIIPEKEPAPAQPTAIDSIIPRIPEFVRESEVPHVPSYLIGPFIFVDARLGIAMLAGWPVLAGVRSEVEPWIFRLHGDHWCTVRKARIDDLETIENLKRYSRPLYLMRAQ